MSRFALSLAFVGLGDPQVAASDAPYRFDNGNGYSALTLKQELNNVQWSEIEQIGDSVLGHLEQQPAPALLIDLSPLNYMGSAMVALIVRLWKNVKDRGGRMVVVNQHELVREVLKLAGLEQVWSIVSTREEGVEALGKAAKGGPGRMGLVMAVLGLLAVAGAGAGLYLLIEPPVNWDMRISAGIMFGCSALGIIAGTITSVAAAGVRRAVGIVVVGASLVVMLVGILKWPGAPHPAAVGAATPDEAAGDALP